jgi:hypothetical protein
VEGVYTPIVERASVGVEDGTMIVECLAYTGELNQQYDTSIALWECECNLRGSDVCRESSMT